MTKAEAYQLWKATVFRLRGRRGYWTLENGVLTRALSWPQFWRVVQLQARLARSDPGGNIRL